MPKKTATPKTPTDDAPKISPIELARAVTNSPALSPDQVQLGDRVFTIIDLEYDDYLVFTTMLGPLLEIIMQRIGASAISVPNVVLPASDILSVTGLVKFASKDLPAMAQIVLRGSDPSITIEEVKKLARNPFKLAEIVVAQILRNNIISDFSSVFLQLRRLIPTKNQNPTA